MSCSIVVTSPALWPLAESQKVDWRTASSDSKLHSHCRDTRLSAAAKQGSPTYVTHTHLEPLQPRHCHWWRSSRFPTCQNIENCPFPIKLSLDQDFDLGLKLCSFGHLPISSTIL